METRILFWVVWGLGVVVLFSIVLAWRMVEWREFRDPRARRDLLEGFGLWITAVASGVAITAYLLGSDGTGLRGIAGALALGGFFGVGLVMATDRPRRKDESPTSRGVDGPTRRV